MELALSKAHDLGIHTGDTILEGTPDHTLHTVRVIDNAYDANGDGSIDGENGLESDLIQAKARIDG